MPGPAPILPPFVSPRIDRAKYLIYRRAQYQLNKEKLRQQDREFRQRHPDRIKEKNRRQYSSDIENRREASRLWRLAFPDRTKELVNNWRSKNKPRIREYQKTPAQAQKRGARQNKKYKTDLHFKIKSILSARVWAALRGKTKSDRTLNLLGCSIDELKLHLQGLFTPGMSWNNLGKWHIDHKRPCASFDLTDPAQQRACFHWSNLQPLWALDNILKKDKLIVYA